MGLQGQLNDVASGSIFLQLVALLATCLYRLRCCLVASSEQNPSSEQLSFSLNRTLSYTFSSHHAPLPDCVFCLSGLNHGDHVTALSCRHVFHKPCFDGWIRYINFTCPLCRYPFANFSPTPTPPMLAVRHH